MQNEQLPVGMELRSIGDPLFRDGTDIYKRDLPRFRRAYIGVGRPVGQRILDIGAYPGTGFAVFGPDNEYTAMGITRSEHFDRLISTFCFQYMEANIEEYSEPCDADVILFMEIIEHLRRPYAALRNLSKMARPGALVYVTTNNASYFGYIMKLAAGRAIYDSISTEESGYPGHTRYFQLTELSTELQKLGFRIRSSRRINLLPRVEYYRRKGFGMTKRMLGWLLPSVYATHLEIVAVRE